jgi:hypothetical protein
MISADGVALLRTLPAALNLAVRAATLSEFLILADSPDGRSGLFSCFFRANFFPRNPLGTPGNKFRLRADAQGCIYFLRA